MPARGKPQLFIDPAKLGGNVRGHLKAAAEILPPDALEARLKALGEKSVRVRLDPETTPVRFAQALEAAGAKIVKGDDPCILPKAIKTDAEIEGARAAHVRDGAAMVRFLAWLDATAPSGRVDEVGAAIKLEEFRRETGELKDISFDSISAAGPHGAVVHYRPTRATSLKLRPRSLYLIDSGGQYPDGTTDITRTIAIGTPTGRDEEALHARAPRATSPSPRRGSRRARAARISIPSRGGRCGRLGSTLTTAPGTASAAISACTSRRSGCRATAASRSSPA